MADDAISLSESELSKWIGAYEFDEGIIRHLSLKDGQLYSQREGSIIMKILPLTKTKFFFEGSDTEYEFYNNDDGNRMVKFTAGGETKQGRGIIKSPPVEKSSVELPDEVLKQYIGIYELQPTFQIEVKLKEDGVFAQATGQPVFQIFASEKDKFFLKVVPAEIEFNRNSENDIESLTLFQGGQEMVGKKVE